ncbi:hypothetical protein [Gloeobacter kilaueensis]|uniref:Uncharacterized protein n=1 Tax=Gloeobacter kilaueensis (strain ATCC BAA-2537 / CCAP 1431/1 / ULC 316 / JS1) TaxID=1183438 RepID=U5QG48_GLOK1|nr:hypothetical protein [Gloeobacter kilaueensis]AGY57937.1 hypothetical protein GKIL_1691 [Gloeobacter kilaueensis JS1]
MKTRFLPEPELQFGNDGKHIDIRFGLMQYGPLIQNDELRKEILIGIVGTNKTIEAVIHWFAVIQGGIEGKQSNKSNRNCSGAGFRDQ